MEHIFPIRISVLQSSPNINDSDHQRYEIERQRVLLVSSPGTVTPTLQPPPPSPSPVEGVSRRSSSRLSEETSLGYSLPGTYGFLTSRAVQDEVAHGIVSGDQGSFAFTRCEDEPIHTPGAIQSHGVLVGVEMVETGGTRYLCRVVSENSESLCGYPPTQLLGLDILQLFPSEQRPVFNGKALEVKLQYIYTQQSAEPEVFPVDLLDPAGRSVAMWCALHFVGAPHNLLMCEFEPDYTADVREKMNDLPPEPVNTLDRKFTDAASSFESKSEPLHLTEDVSSVFRGQARAMETIRIMSRIQQQLSDQTEVQQLLDVIVGLMKELTGYHRIMAYRFDAEYNGEVLAEVVDPRASTDVFKGLHFPASDIPKQARDLYQRMRVRVLHDRTQETSRLISRPLQLLDEPLDLTCSLLRALSPVHLKYYDNMGIRSSISVSLHCRGKLWGLVCCLSYGPTGFRVPFPVRELCSWFGLSASTCLEKLLLSERLTNRGIVDTIRPVFDSETFFTTSSAGLLQLFKAEFGFLVIQGEARTIGRLSSHLEAVTLLRYICFRNFAEIFSSRNIAKDFSDLVYEPGFTKIAGLLCIPLSRNAGDFLIFFRDFQETEVHWAGDPNVLKQGKSGMLEPRNSFKKWIERVKGTCSPWTDEQFEAAALTRLVYGNFIRVWRDKEAALHDSRMKRLLMVNLSHEIRTPLNAVINYLEMALEHGMEQETKEILRMSQSASKSVIFVLDELLHITGIVKQPPESLVHVPFDLVDGIHHALEPLKEHAFRRKLTFEMIEDDNLPTRVMGDPERLQQSIANIVENSIQHTEKGGILMHLGLVSATGDTCVIRVSVQDTGHGMSSRDLDQIFQEFEQMADDEPDEDKADDGQTAECDSCPKGNARKECHMGVGLAVVARYVKHSGGQIRAHSTLGVGTSFIMEIPLQLPPDYGSYLLPSSEVLSLNKLDPPARSTNSSDPSTSRPGIASRFPASGGLFTSKSDGDGLPGIVVAGPPNARAETIAQRRVTASEPAISGAPRELMKAREKLRIIVADDNSVNCAVLMKRLNKIGHDVKLCRDGQQCVEAYQQDRDAYDLILMDINMPIVNGVQATKRIRILEEADRTRPQTPVGSSPALLSPREGREGSGASLKTYEWPASPSSPLMAKVEPNTSLIKPSPSRMSSSPSTLPLRDILKPPKPPRSATDPRSSTMRLSEPSLSVPDEITYPDGSYFSLTAKSPKSTSRRSSIFKSFDALPPSKPVFLSSPARRIPIFAVSANLNQHTQQSLEEAGFDGWLPKPVDFTRLELILKGTFSSVRRQEGKYDPKKPKAGGWFKV